MLLRWVRTPLPDDSVLKCFLFHSAYLIKRWDSYFLYLVLYRSRGCIEVIEHFDKCIVTIRSSIQIMVNQHLVLIRNDRSTVP